jgi:hypothetical protein
MRRRVSIFLLLGLLLVLAGLLGRLYLQQQLRHAGVSELVWSGPGWHAGALTLDELTLTLDNGSTFELQQLALAPGWRSGIVLTRAEADRLVLSLPAGGPNPPRKPTLRCCCSVTKPSGARWRAGCLIRLACSRFRQPCPVGRGSACWPAAGGWIASALAAAQPCPANC